MWIHVIRKKTVCVCCQNLARLMRSWNVCEKCRAFILVRIKAAEAWREEKDTFFGCFKFFIYIPSRFFLPFSLLLKINFHTRQRNFHTFFKREKKTIKYLQYSSLLSSFLHPNLRWKSDVKRRARLLRNKSHHESAPPFNAICRTCCAQSSSSFESPNPFSVIRCSFFLPPPVTFLLILRFITPSSSSIILRIVVSSDEPDNGATLMSLTARKLPQLLRCSFSSRK